MGPCSPLKVRRFDSIQVLRKTKFLSSYAESGGFFIYQPRIPAIDPVFLMYGNTKMYERKMRAFQFTWRHFFMAIHAEKRRSECRAAIAVLCMYGVYDTEILLAPSSINFNPQPTLSGASPTLSGASRYAVRSCPYADRSSLTHLIWYV